MKFGICNETFVDWPLDRACRFARQVGYTGLEIAPFTLAPDVRQLTAADRATIRRTIEDADLEILGLHWLLAKTTGLHLTSPDRPVRRATADYLVELAKLCADLGGRVLVFGSPVQRNLLPEVTHEQGVEYAAEVFGSIMPTCQALDVVLAVEPLGPAEGNFLNTADQAVDLIELVGSSHCRLHLDCKAMSTESRSIPELLQRHAPLLEHFHANDPNRQGPGMGELDFRPILSTLGAIDYHGWVSVEVFDYTPGPETLATASIDYLQQTLADLATA